MAGRRGIVTMPSLRPAVLLLAQLTPAHAAALDRRAIVARHSPSLIRVNTSEVAVLGNGAFALSIDVTGLQTLNRTFSGEVNTSSPFRCISSKNSSARCHASALAQVVTITL